MKLLLIFILFASCKSQVVDRQELLQETNSYYVECINGYVWQFLHKAYHPYPSYNKQETCGEYNTRILNYVNLEQQ